MSHPEEPTPPAHPESPDGLSPERRAALRKLGLMTAWTAPTLLMLLRSPRASAQSEVLPPPPDFP